MTVENRFNAIASDPGNRMIQLHAASLARAAEARRAADCVAACNQVHAQRHTINCDHARQECDLRSHDRDQAEISRLAQRVAQLESELAACKCDDDRAPDPLASPPKERKAYAIDPIGKIPPPPPPPEAGVTSRGTAGEIPNYFHVTNLGTLLDVLA